MVTMSTGPLARVHCSHCGRFIAKVEPVPGLRIEERRCGCGRWPLIKVTDTRVAFVVMFTSRIDMEQTS